MSHCTLLQYTVCQNLQYTMDSRDEAARSCSRLSLLPQVCLMLTALASYSAASDLLLCRLRTTDELAVHATCLRESTGACLSTLLNNWCLVPASGD